MKSKRELLLRLVGKNVVISTEGGRCYVRVGESATSYQTHVIDEVGDEMIRFHWTSVGSNRNYESWVDIGWISEIQFSI